MSNISSPTSPLLDKIKGAAVSLAEEAPAKSLPTPDETAQEVTDKISSKLRTVVKNSAGISIDTAPKTISDSIHSLMDDIQKRTNIEVEKAKVTVEFFDETMGNVYNSTDVKTWWVNSLVGLKQLDFKTFQMTFNATIDIYNRLEQIFSDVQYFEISLLTNKKELCYKKYFIDSATINWENTKLDFTVNKTKQTALVVFDISVVYVDSSTCDLSTPLTI